MHQPYEEKLKHKADFRVRYCFYKEQEGGRKSLPYQGYRSDFWYENLNHIPSEIFIIWPEFENEQGDLILTTEKPVNECGTARMWIIIPERRKYHKDKIRAGTKGFFMEGSRKVAACEVIEILDLQTNPTD